MAKGYMCDNCSKFSKNLNYWINLSVINFAPIQEIHLCSTICAIKILENYDAERK